MTAVGEVHAHDRVARLQARHENGHVRLRARMRLDVRVVANASVLAKTIADEGFRIVSGGTDNHLVLIDVFSRGLTGKVAEKTLEHAGITVNKNTIPFDPNPPMTASGVRVGTPALTTRGMGTAEMEEIGRLIGKALKGADNETTIAEVRKSVETLCARFPLYAALLKTSTE
jgi:glycine hydroxymethyltransferase